MSSQIDIKNCSNYNPKTGKCRIPHFSGTIKFTGVTCDGTKCYYKRLQSVLSAVESYCHIQCSNCEETSDYCSNCDVYELKNIIKKEN